MLDAACECIVVLMLAGSASFLLVALGLWLIVSALMK